MRFAHVTGARNAKELWAYLPHHFVIVGGGPVRPERDIGKGTTQLRHGYIIGGLDQAGWTLDDYVIPRLASAWIAAREITATQAVDWISLYGKADYQPDAYVLMQAAIEPQEPISVHKPAKGRDYVTDAEGRPHDVYTGDELEL